ncbi:hypothetical protein WHR41_08694 [Cladosporium halotolerans]|uniref:Uncharacterized protein n=1 Tax=Cladosporium halotolerans TaxID=1052096 RepID=A0AB34KEG5_9PEZI
MPEQRSSSAVRNLRTLFENKANQDNDDDARGRSPSGRFNAADANGRPLSKVRASFINVQHPIMDPAASSPPKHEPTSHAKRASAFEARTQSFTSNDIPADAISALKKEISNERERRSSDPNIVDTEGAMESVASTPAVEVREDQAMGVIDHAASKLSEMELPPPDEEDENKAKAQTEPKEQESTQTSHDKNVLAENEPPANPDKPVTGVEEERGSMKPALPDNENAVSGGEALPPVAEDLRPHNKTNETTPAKSHLVPQSTAKATPQAKTAPQKSVSKPAQNVQSAPTEAPPASTTSPRKATGDKPGPLNSTPPRKTPDASLKSPPSNPKSPSSSKSPLSPIGGPKQPMDRKSSRSSLTAPTAASSARGRRESNTVKPAAKPQPRETTKPINLPSHLTAPTAASRARHEPDTTSKPATTSRPSTTATRAPPKPQVSTSKPAARSSTASARTSTAARPDSRTSGPAPRKSTASSAVPDSSFLERMMRPTASSAQKSHDRVASEPKSPPRRTKSVAKKPAAAAGASASARVNGAAKPAARAGAATKPVKEVEEKAGVEEAQVQLNGKGAEETEIPDVPVPAEEVKAAETEPQPEPELEKEKVVENGGAATPQHVAAGEGDGEEKTAPALESTPAFGGDGIR